VPAPEPAASELEAIVAALGDPRTYGDVAPVEHVQTHISHVFLVGHDVYKLKKPVTFPFLDFGTFEQRRRLCHEEVRLNHRLAPGVYRGVLPLTVVRDGRIRLGGDGRVLDHVVWMRRLPAARLLPVLLRADAADDALMDALAERLARFHAAAPSGPDVAAHAAPERIAATWADVLDGVNACVPQLLAAEDLELLADFGPRFVRTHETLLRARQAGGRIREGHGDLHAEHVCVVEKPSDDPAEALPPGIYVFDCIEFSRPLRCVDVAAEVAFLTMDLERRGHAALGARFARSYAAAAGDPDVLLLLPYYVAARACIRGKVEALKAGETEVDPAEREEARARARAFFALALRHAWQAAGPAVVACAGLSGSGKSTLAQALADATGFTVLSSDALRKRGGMPAAGADALYSPEARGATYAALCAATEMELAGGRGVVADATWMRRADRERLAAATRAQRRPLVFVECVAAEAAVRERLEARTHASSISDARWETYVAQRAAWDPFGPDEPHLRVDTGGAAAAARAAAQRALWPWMHGHRPSGDQR
jgi:aminoglycoside phosphotransferase family enzyme/predicted kinase